VDGRRTRSAGSKGIGEPRLDRAGFVLAVE